jgi:hypothetical protein
MMIISTQKSGAITRYTREAAVPKLQDRVSLQQLRSLQRSVEMDDKIYTRDQAQI